MTGSEGLLGVVVEVRVKLLPKPACARVLLAAFEDVESAGAAVGAIIAGGVLPAGLEMMDNFAIRATDDFCGAGYPTDAAAILLCELDGIEAEVEDRIAEVRAVLHRCGATEVRVGARRGRTRALLGRAQGRLPRRRPALAGLPLHGRHHPAARTAGGAQPHEGALRGIGPAHHERVPRRRRQPAPADPLRRERAGRARDGRARRCTDPRIVRRGRGTITGEHGVGVEKIDQMCVQFASRSLRSSTP